MNRHLQSIVSGEQRITFYQTVIGTWIIVAIYAVLHDQYLVRIAAEHFTVYHPNPQKIEDPSILAASIALKASVSPGILLGITSWFAGRSGLRPKIKVKAIFQSVLIVIGITEFCSVLTGIVAYSTGFIPYPKALYPNLSRPLVTTQTIQLTAYYVATIASCIMLLVLFRKRPANSSDKTSR